MRYIIAIILFLSSINVYAIEVRNEDRSYTTSVLIPCHHLHARYLYTLIKSYENQSVLPDEVLISLSGTRYLSQHLIDQIKNEPWPFPVRLILSEEPQSEPVNRNILAYNASCDILISQDADDVPHPQRVEVIKYFFEKYDILHLMHQFVLHKSFHGFKLVEDFQSIQWRQFQTIDQVFNESHSIANGAAAIRREVFLNFQWDQNRTAGCDVNFNHRVYSHTNKTIVLEFPLYLYNRYLSTYNPENPFLSCND